MGEINLQGIFNFLMTFYKCHDFTVFSTYNKKTRKPLEMIIDFNVDNLPKRINMKRLNQQLGKHINFVKHYFVTIEEDKIILVIEFYDSNRIFQPDMDFCLN